MPECGYCKDCKWWDQDWHWNREMATKEMAVEGGCDRIYEPDSKLTEWSDPHEGSVIRMAADFGCVQWEPK